MISLDIFCDVIDNYGDAGVCLHLARNLSFQDYSVRLFCNNLTVLNTLLNEQDLNNDHLTIENWEQPLTIYQASQVVISAFNCRFDPVTTQSLQQAQNQNGTIIINLEYLSAEDWVESCHGLTSFVDNLNVYYFFPGFTSKTGGLNVDRTFKDQCKLNLQKLKEQLLSPHSTRTFSLFGYHNPIIADLIKVCSHSACTNEMLVFEGLALENLESITKLSFKLNETTKLNDKLSINVSPMVSHERYDEILLNSDFNLVRGEDSIVRAMHTGHPFLWHIYPQDENAHLTKLQSFLQRMEHICLNDIPQIIENHHSCPYLAIDKATISKACQVIYQTMMDYNSQDHFAKDFNLDEFEQLCKPIYYNFACYLCDQTDLTESLNQFIHSKL